MKRHSYGLYPGTFDPIHVAHLALARQALRELGLAGVVFLPAGSPPNKPGAKITDGRDRVAMIRAAIAGIPGLSVSDLETKRSGPSFLVDTLESARLHGLGPIPAASSIVLIGGSDLARDLPNWRNPARILALAELVYFERPGEPLDEKRLRALLGPASARVSARSSIGIDLRSSDIRAKLVAGLPVEGSLPHGVEAYIRSHGLYQI